MLVNFISELSIVQLFMWLEPELTGALSSVAWPTGAKMVIFYFFSFQWCCLAVQGSQTGIQHVVSVESSSLLLLSIKT